MIINLKNILLTCTVVCALPILAACNIGGMYVATSYDGVWRFKFKSEQCGDYTTDFSVNGGGTSIRVYDKKYVFRLKIKDGKSYKEGPSIRKTYKQKGTVFVGYTEYLGSKIDFPFYSYSSGGGTWQATDCSGTIEMKKIEDF